MPVLGISANSKIRICIHTSKSLPLSIIKLFISRFRSRRQNLQINSFIYFFYSLLCYPLNHSRNKNKLFISIILQFSHKILSRVVKTHKITNKCDRNTRSQKSICTKIIKILPIRPQMTVFSYPTCCCLIPIGSFVHKLISYRPSRSSSRVSMSHIKRKQTTKSKCQLSYQRNCLVNSWIFVDNFAFFKVQIFIRLT